MIETGHRQKNKYPSLSLLHTFEVTIIVQWIIIQKDFFFKMKRKLVIRIKYTGWKFWYLEFVGSRKQLLIH